MESLESIMKQLEKEGWQITTAESCTGGLLAGRLIDYAGASKVYRQGFITYANEAKEELLGVSHQTLEQFGAVSEETAKEMAEGAAKASGAEAALVTTGIAGPDGGSREKPVGLVYIGCHLKGRTAVRKCQFQGNRREVREQAVEEALNLLGEMLIQRK